MAVTTVKLVMPSEVRLVDIAHGAAEKVASLAGFDEDEALNVGLAVREAVINAILHGNRLETALKVELTLRSNARGVKARILDRGRGFDPHAAPDPTSPENQLRTSGRGLLLIRAFVDRVDFKYRAGRGMEVTLEKRLGRKPKVSRPRAVSEAS